MKLSKSTTCVVDVGARYGMHPSWLGFSGELLYLAFEPDREEAERLRQNNKQPGFEVIETALGKKEEEREFYITKHRGYCSFYKPDINSEWFKKYRPGEGEIESIVSLKTCSLDTVAITREIKIDFLKIDTEGSELDILQGADKELEFNVLGIRCEVHFQACYENQPLFPAIHNNLLEKDFFLLNFDYFGRGLPVSPLFGNPNPLLPDNQRYGILIGTDAVFLKKYEKICDHYMNLKEQEELAYSTLKYSYFCFLNNAPDLAIDTLLKFIETKNTNFNEEVKGSILYKSLMRICIEYFGQYRVNPKSSEWELARYLSKKIFNLELEPDHNYWKLIQAL